MKAVSISSPEEGAPLSPTLVSVAPSPSSREPVASRDVAMIPAFAGGVSTAPNGESIAPSTSPTRKKSNPTATPRASPTRPPFLGIFDPGPAADPVTASPTTVTGDNASPSMSPAVDMTLIPTVAGSTNLERPPTSTANETLNPTADYNTTGARRVEGTANQTSGGNPAPILKSVDHKISSAINVPVPTPVQKGQPTRPPFLHGLLPEPTHVPITDISTVQPASTNNAPSPTSATGEPTVSASPVGQTAGPTQMDSLQGPSFSPAPSGELSGFPNPSTASSPTSSPSPDQSPEPTPVQGAPQRPPFFDGFFDPSASPTFAPSSSAFPSSAGSGHDTLQPAIVGATPSTEPSTPAFQYLLPSKECAPELACPWIKKFPGYQLYIVKDGVCIERCQWEERLRIFKLVGWKCGFCP